MRNFSGEPKTLMSEAPAPIKWLLDPQRPKAVRVGLALFAAFIILNPFISMRSSKRSASTSASAMERKESAPEPLAETAKSLPAVIQQTEIKPEPIKREETESALFPRLPDLFPVPIAIEEEKSGAVWVSTVQNIFEYRDGNGTKKLDRGSYEGVFNSDLPALTAAYIDDAGELWAGALDGLVLHYVNYDWKVSWEPREPIRDRITAFVRRGSTLFIGTAKGLWKWDLSNGKLSRYKGFAENQINVLFKTVGQEIFLGARDGVWQLTPKGWLHVLPMPHSRGALSMAQSVPGRLWIGTENGIVDFDIESKEQRRTLTDSTVVALASSADGSLWAGTQSNGLSYFDGKEWFSASVKEGLPGEHVSQILADGKGKLWLGIPQKGVHVLPVEKLREWIGRHAHQETVIDENAPRIYKNACQAGETEFKKNAFSGDVAVERRGGTTLVFFRGEVVCPSIIAYRSADGRVMMLNKGKLYDLSTSSAPIDIPANFRPEEIKKMYIDSASRVWFTRSIGPLMYDKGVWNDHVTDPAFTNNVVQAFAEDKQGGVWLGTAPALDVATQTYPQAPLHRYFNGTWTHFTVDQGVPAHSVTSLRVLNDGRIVVGTPVGFAFMTDKGMAPASTDKFFRPGAVMAADEDAAGRIWYSHVFFQKGLSWFENGEVQRISTPGKLFADTIAGIVHDGREKVWLMSTSGQVAVYSKQALLALKDDVEEEAAE